MRLYHTSTTKVERPDTARSREHLDFGRGFYLTPLREQAVRYGERFLRRGDSAVLNTYDLDADCQGFSRKVFEAYDGEWLDFVSACRKGMPHSVCDIIEGGIANDKVFNTIDLYFSGILTREQALDQLRYAIPNYQVCLTSQRLIDAHLHFVTSEKL